MKKQYVKPATTVVEVDLENIIAQSPETDFKPGEGETPPDHGDVRENNNSFWGESIW